MKEADPLLEHPNMLFLVDYVTKLNQKWKKNSINLQATQKSRKIA